jgi:hypothetical protein
MSSFRAVRYRRLALATNDRADANLLLKLADDAIGGCSAPLNGFRPGHSSKMSRRQKQKTSGGRLSGIRSVLYIENVSGTVARRSPLRLHTIFSPPGDHRR